MTLREHLKKICDYEQAIYEKQATIEKTGKEIERVGEKVAKKKEELNSLLEKKENQLEQKITQRKRCLNYQKEGLITPMLITLIVMVATVIFHLLLRHFIVNVAEATTISDTLPTLIFMNLVIAAIIAFLIWIGALLEFVTLTIIGVVIDAILTVIGACYLRSALNNEITFNAAILRAMLFFIAIEVVICIIACLITNSSQEKTLVNNKKRAKILEGECKNAQEEVENVKERISNYTKKTNHSMHLMKLDFEKKQKELKLLKESLAKLYAQNIVHPKYQNWVAVATFYEYIDIGRCYELKGPHGAYNLYEQELIANKIVGSLGAINSNTSGIASSQLYIRGQLSTIIDRLDNMQIDTYGI